MKIGIMGLGKIGRPLAVAMSHAGHNVVGYDINSENMRKDNFIEVEKGYYGKEFKELLYDSPNLSFDSLENVINKSDLIFLTIQTPHDKEYEGICPMPEKTKDFNYDFLQRAMQEVNKLVKSEKVVIIMSTCLPTTIRTKIIPYLNPLIKLCYNPVFISAGNILPDFFNPEFTLLGTYDNIATQKVEQFYKTIHNKPIMKMSIESAELSKVAYNTFITMKVCFANMLMEICHKTPNGNVDDVTNFIKAANDRLISPKYLSGGTLDGGPCHNRDRIAMANLEERLNLSTSIYKTLVHTSEAQTKWLASLVSEEQRKSNLLPIMILGTAFKPNIGITTGSGALLLKHYLIYNFDCKDVDHYEPFNKNVNQGQINPLKNKSIFVIGINHDIFKTWKFPDGSIIIDPFRYIPKSDKYKVVYVGINEN